MAFGSRGNGIMMLVLQWVLAIPIDEWRFTMIRSVPVVT
jgi:hypothetical protein